MKAKTILLISGIAVFLAISGYGVKYFYDISYEGNNTVKLVKNYDQIRTLNELVKKQEFKGKVLYIDLWGVYCRPCIEEFKYAAELKKTFKNKEVEFIYLASPYNRFNDEQKWKAAIKKYNLEGYHVLMNMDFYYAIWKEVPEMENPFSIPHYLIIDKNGSVIDPNAPRPSEKENLYAALNKSL